MNKFLLITLIALFAPVTTQAQTIVPDDSLPNNSTVNIIDNVHNISGGTTAGANLFHSFSQFNLNTDGTASFDNAIEIENIFSRVTGTDISNIDGLIEANGSANLFLLNPNGIVFGENAAIDIDGSFSAIAGESIQFPDGEYSAVDPINSTLSINLPLGVQLGEAPGTIESLGSGSGLFFNEFGEPDFSNKTQGLTNSRIDLVAGNILIDGGNINAPEGLINLIATSGSVDTTPQQIIAPDPTGTIKLVSGGSVDSSSGAGAGEINIQAANLNIFDGSAIVAINEGENAPGTININAFKTSIVGESLDFPSFISTDNGFEATQSGGIIDLSTGDLLVDAGGVISASSYGSAPGGVININANSVEVNSGGAFASSIAVESAGGSQGGTVNLNADTLTISRGGSLTATARGDSTGGTLNLDAAEIIVAEPEVFDGETFNPTILADSFDEADGGRINIDTENLLVADSGQISTSTGGAGTGGNIDIDASTVTVTNTELNQEFVTGIFSASGIEPTEEILGAGGQINIDADSLTLDNQAVISSRTLSGGDAGKIVITGGTIKVNHQSTLNSLARGSGNGGNLDLNVDQVELLNGGQINTGTDSSGNAGDLIINARKIEVEGFSPAGNSGILSVGVESSGNGGNIQINAETVNLQSGGVISSSNFSTVNADLEPGTGNPGSVSITADSLEIQGSEVETGVLSKVNANSGGTINLNTSNLAIAGTNATVSAASEGAGNGGDITLNSSQTELKNEGTISVSAIADGNAGNIILNGDLLEGDQGKILAESEVSGGGDITLNTKEIDLNNQSLISTSVAQSAGGGGDLSITNQELILLRNDSDLRANAFAGSGGNINITTDLLFRDLTSDIDASSRFGIDGTVELTTIDGDRNLITVILPETIQDPTAMISGACPVADENSFAWIGNGGIPSVPGEANSIQASWNDLRPLSGNQKVTNSVPAKSQTKNISEADRLVADRSGDIYLLASHSLNGDRWSKSNCR